MDDKTALQPRPRRFNLSTLTSVERFTDFFLHKRPLGLHLFRNGESESSSDLELFLRFTHNTLDYPCNGC
jgi:hypothetical protein